MGHEHAAHGHQLSATKFVDNSGRNEKKDGIEETVISVISIIHPKSEQFRHFELYKTFVK